VFDDEEVNDSLGTIRQCWMSVESMIRIKNSTICFRSVWWTSFTKAPCRRQYQREGNEYVDEYNRARVKTIFDVTTQNEFRTPSRIQGSVPCAICGFWKVPKCLACFVETVSTIADCICSSWM